MGRWRPRQVPQFNRLCLRILVGVIVAGSMPGCDCSPSATVKPPLSIGSPLRDVRVRIVTGAVRLRLRAERPITAVTEDGMHLSTWPGGRWFEVRGEPTGGVGVGDRVLAVDGVVLAADGGGAIQLAEPNDDDWAEARTYPGRLRFRIDEGGRLDVVNYVDVEDYVGSVVAAEVWPTFETEALRAQAIAVRTFVLYETQRRGDASHGVAATQGSQVYRGLRDDAIGRRAEEATRYTRGIVCTWNDGEGDRLFSTYYSSVCGGMTQSAAIFGPASDIKPLAGGVSCDYCKIAPGDTYRWGPIQVSAREVLEKLVARYPEMGSLEQLTGIDAVDEAPGGRIIRLRLTGSSGETHEIMAERFRVAVGPDLMKSTDCKIRLIRGEVVFSRGRGYGHGLGLCQWGMQGQALAGKRAGEILRYYYPGAELTRVY